VPSSKLARRRARDARALRRIAAARRSFVDRRRRPAAFFARRGWRGAAISSLRGIAIPRRRSLLAVCSLSPRWTGVFVVVWFEATA